jgi:hypothetical protein
MEMRQVFVSHVEEDSNLATALAKMLEAQGYTTWYYERDNLPGESYVKLVGEIIDDCECLLLFISDFSLNSVQVTNELIRAYEGAKHLVPILNSITHADFQSRRPDWRQCLGAATSVAMTSSPSAVCDRIVAGLKALGVEPRGQADSSTQSSQQKKPQFSSEKLTRSRAFILAATVLSSGALVAHSLGVLYLAAVFRVVAFTGLAAGSFLTILLCLSQKRGEFSARPLWTNVLMIALAVFGCVAAVASSLILQPRARTGTGRLVLVHDRSAIQNNELVLLFSIQNTSTSSTRRVTDVVLRVLLAVDDEVHFRLQRVNLGVHSMLAKRESKLVVNDLNKDISLFPSDLVVVLNPGEGESFQCKITPPKDEHRLRIVFTLGAVSQDSLTGDQSLVLSEHVFEVLTDDLLGVRDLKQHPLNERTLTQLREEYGTILRKK